MKKIYYEPFKIEEFINTPELQEKYDRAEKALKIATQIYSLRKKRGLTQKQLANKAGIKQSNISRLENADYEGYTYKTLRKIAKALRINVNNLLIHTDESQCAQNTVCFEQNTLTNEYILPSLRNNIMAYTGNNYNRLETFWSNRQSYQILTGILIKYSANQNYYLSNI
jgi:transcriptional regulator with XRE-family HTH domain